MTEHHQALQIHATIQHKKLSLADKNAGQETILQIISNYKINENVVLFVLPTSIFPLLSSCPLICKMPKAFIIAFEIRGLLH